MAAAALAVLALLPTLALCLNAASAAGDVTQAEKKATYFVILDAGSTGTRAYVYKFWPAAETAAGFELTKSDSMKVSPGLSSFANRPERAGDQVRNLLQQAREFVPEDQWNRTLAIVRATAGLRLLRSFQRQRILRSVSEALRRSNFETPESDAARIISGDEEAKFAWGSVNYLVNRLSSDFVPVLEMGGGSLQVAYKAGATASATASYNLRQRLQLHTHSYLGLGSSQSLVDHLERDASSETFNSPCVAAGKTFEHEFGGKSFNITGAAFDSNARPAECKRLAKGLVDSKKVHEELPLNARNPTVYCLSAAYYQIKHISDNSLANVTSASCTLGPKCKKHVTTVGHLSQAVNRICTSPPDSGKYEPFYCFQMAVLSSVLEHGFHLKQETKIVGFSSKHASWTLGATFEFLNRDLHGGAGRDRVDFSCLLASFTALLASALKA